MELYAFTSRREQSVIIYFSDHSRFFNTPLKTNIQLEILVLANHKRKRHFQNRLCPLSLFVCLIQNYDGFSCEKNEFL